MKSIWAIGVSSLAISIATSAAAQQANSTTTGAPQASTAIGEVVVTAQRRSENIQKTPLAIDAVSGAELVRAGVSNISTLTKELPSVQFSNDGTSQIFYVRGIGSVANNSLSDAAISISANGVVLGRSYMLPGQLFDLSQMEVLKGPQGTLYGRNATGGALNVLFNKPTFNDSVDLGVDIGNYHLVHTDIAANMAVSDDLAVRLSTQFTSRDGYLSNGSDDDVSQSGRFQVRYEPTSKLSVNLVADYEHVGGVGAGFIDVNNFAADQKVTSTSPQEQAIFAKSDETQFSWNPHTYHQTWGAAATINYATDYGTLTFIPSYRQSAVDINIIDGFGIVSNEHEHQFSSELRFASTPNQPFTYVVGAFYMNESLNNAFTINSFIPPADQFFGMGLTQNSTMTQTTNTYAVFADGAYAIAPHLRLIAGVRYTDEQKTANGVSTLDTYPTPTTAPSLDSSLNDSKVTYRGGIEADITPQSLLYATVATGFQSGGFFLAPGANQTFLPETITAVTVGSKNLFFDKKLLLNIEAFRWNLYNQQLTYPGLDTAGEEADITANVGSLTSQGIEIDTKFKAARNTVIGADIEYLDAKINNYTFETPAPINAFGMPGPVDTGCSQKPASNPYDANVSCAGKRPPQAPQWSMTFLGEQTIPLNDGSSFVLDVTGHYQSDTLVGPDFISSEVQPAYWQTDLSLTYHFPKRNVSLTAYVNNVANVTIISNAGLSPYTGILPPGGGFGRPSGPPIVDALIQPPRTYGLRLAAHF